MTGIWPGPLTRPREKRPNWLQNVPGGMTVRVDGWPWSEEKHFEDAGLTRQPGNPAGARVYRAILNLRTGRLPAATRQAVLSVGF
jgi:hypothetical protein